MATQSDYKHMFQKFQAFLGQELQDLQTGEVLEQYLRGFFDTLWWDGAPLDQGTKLLAAVQWNLPQFDLRDKKKASLTSPSAKLRLTASPISRLE